MTCQFCGHPLTGTQNVSCSKKPCLLAAKRARSRARRDAEPRLARKRKDDGRTTQFPPELDYLDHDPGIPVDQMLEAQRDPALRRMMHARRIERTTRLQERLKDLEVGLST